MNKLDKMLDKWGAVVVHLHAVFK